MLEELILLPPTRAFRPPLRGFGEALLTDQKCRKVLAPGGCPSGPLRYSPDSAGREVAAVAAQTPRPLFPNPTARLGSPKSQSPHRGTGARNKPRQEVGSRNEIATFKMPSITAARGTKRGVSEPPQAASSRAPRDTRSAGHPTNARAAQRSRAFGYFWPIRSTPRAGPAPHQSNTVAQRHELNDHQTTTTWTEHEGE